MAKGFDIYLRKHLVECDLLVYSIPYRNSISITNRLILEAALNGYLLHKFAATQMGSEVEAHIDQMIKLCLEKLSLGMDLGASVDFKAHAKLYMEHNPIIIDAQAINMLRLVFDASASMEIAALVLDTEICHSLGVWCNGLTLDSKVIGTLTQKFVVAETVTAFIQEATEKLIKVLYLDGDDTVIEASDLNISMKRHRLLCELDSSRLTDIDGMTLEELDYILLT